MKVIDTNILARFFIDDPDDQQCHIQRQTAIEILSQPVSIPITVILELEWVMRGFYKIDKQTILSVYQTLLNFSHVIIEDELLLIQALKLYQQGLDFADSLHIVRLQQYSFITFDVKFFKKAANAGLKIELAK
ncbi:type II toxin-antitoxin system VapC family toxin [Acinetobacter populi]|uniref:PIN domain-containing protein n=1 Tax=Acinetobacter populi TaxID=1582270 RepID=A0A1Z9Z1Q0_9GAMM|nr:type II toxin-antitoxin system VapC family toxin [Acinetobacter populi]OUY08369.1 hypothetical protein CAP51_01750 [Acinetobacter populi]